MMAPALFMATGNRHGAWLANPAITNAWIADAAYTGTSGTLTSLAPAKGTIALTGVASPVVTANGWATGKNGMVVLNGTTQYLTGDALAALVTGLNVPWSVTFSFQLLVSAATGKIAIFFTDTSDSLRFHGIQTFTSGGVKWAVFRNTTASVSAFITTPIPDLNRHVMSMVFTGTTVSVWLDGVLTSVNGSSLSVASLTLSKFTIAAFRGATVSAFTQMNLRAVAFGTTAWSNATRIQIENDLILEAA